MADFTKRIQVIIDVAAQSAKTQLNDLKTRIGETDGLFNKIKVGAKGALDSISPAMWVAAGTAAVKGIQTLADQFTKSAIAAGKFADATGFAVEPASRLIEVAGDLGIEAGTLETAINKMNKTAGSTPQVFKDLGIQIKYASDGSVDAQGTFLSAVDAIKAIKDPTDKAAAANKVFGKGWTSMAELINEGSDQIVSSMKKVSDGIAITPEELETAKKYRAALDDLKDSAAELGREAGSHAAAGLSDLFEVVSQGLGLLDQLPGKFKNAILAGGLESTIGGAKSLWHAFFGDPADARKAEDQLHQVTSQITVLNDEAQNAANSVDDINQAFSDLDKALSGERSLLDIQDSFDNITTAAQEAWDAAQAGAPEAARKQRDYQREIISTKQEVLKYIGTLGDIPPEKKTGILALIDQGLYAQAYFAIAQLGNPKTAQVNAVANTGSAENELAYLTRTRNAYINAQIVSKGGAGYSPNKQFASGTDYAPGGVALVGEQGPELVDLPRGSKVSTAGETRRRLGGTTVVNNWSVTVNNPTGSDPTATQRALERWQRRNGTR